MPSFNAIDLGDFCYVCPDPAENDIQINAYPGVDGLEILDLASRGGQTTIHGACVGIDFATLAAIENTWISMKNAGVVATLIDSLGTSWANVRILKFRPHGPIEDVVGYGWGREFEMILLHASM
jgi:hypothetical protein